MQLRWTELLRRRVGVIHRSWNKRRSPTSAPSDGLQRAGRQTCDGDIMSSSHKTSPGVSERHAFCFGDFFFFPRSVGVWGGRPGWIDRRDPGEGAHSCPLPSLSSTLGAFVITHRALWQTSPKNVCDRTFSGNTAELGGEARDAKQSSFNVAHADENLKPVLQICHEILVKTVNVTSCTQGCLC